MNSRKQGRLKRVEFYAVIAFVLVVCVSILFVSVTVAFAVRRSVVNAAAENRSLSAQNDAAENTLAATSSGQDASSQGTPFQSAALQDAATQGVSDPNSASSSSAVELSTVSGMVTDSYCGARHSRNSNRSSTECVRYCTHRGAGYILVSSGGVYMLRGNKSVFNKFAGQRAKVTGTLDGRVIGVRSMVAGE